MFPFGLPKKIGFSLKDLRYCNFKLMVTYYFYFIFDNIAGLQICNLLPLFFMPLWQFCSDATAYIFAYEVTHKSFWSLDRRRTAASFSWYFLHEFFTQ